MPGRQVLLVHRSKVQIASFLRKWAPHLILVLASPRERCLLPWWRLVGYRLPEIHRCLVSQRLPLAHHPLPPLRFLHLIHICLHLGVHSQLPLLWPDYIWIASLHVKLQKALSYLNGVSRLMLLHFGMNSNINRFKFQIFY